jgi:hypothetical protein
MLEHFGFRFGEGESPVIWSWQEKPGSGQAGGAPGGLTSVEPEERP